MATTSSSAAASVEMPSLSANPSHSSSLKATSSLSSSSSVVSRQSSTRSTSSVQAVPFRTPIRGGSVNPAYRTGNSGSGPRPLTNSALGEIPGSPDGYFVPLERIGSIPSGDRDSLRASSGDVTLLEDARPGAARAGSSTLSDKPARMAISGLNGAEIMIVRKTVGDFTFADVLGEGSYSTVTLVTEKSPPYRSYALKVLDKEHIKREKKTKYVLIERDVLKMLDGHPGIVRLYWTFQDARSLYYVLELAKNGELLKWIKKFGSFSLPSATYYAAQILSAVEHMHSKGVIHRDLKPENILIDEDMRVKITDFGTAKVLGPSNAEPDEDTKPKTRSFVGTPEYVSPEILSEKKESSKSSDYWGFGCILFQIIAGRPPFQARTEYLMFRKIIQLEYEFPEGFPAQARDLIEKLLVLDPLERIGGGVDGINDIKSHPFFSTIDFATIWKIPAPPIETGIAQPKIEEKGEFVLQDFDDSHYFGSEDDERIIGRDGEYNGELAEAVVVGSEPPVTKWTGILLPSESIILASPILDRTAFLSKKRTLILTDFPRLICIKETLTKVTLKSEVFIATTAKGPSTQSFVKADTEGDKIFVVKTSQRTYKYEEPSGAAGRWVAEIRSAHLRGLVVRSA